MKDSAYNDKKILFISYVPFMSYMYNGLKDSFSKFNVIPFEVWNKIGFISKIALVKKYDYIHSFWAKNSYNDSLSCKLAGSKFINHYIGSDVLISAKKRNKALNISKLSYKTLAVSQHLINELNCVGIENVELFEPFYFENAEISKDILYPSDKMILTYIPEGKEKFYGYKFILEAAENFPKYKFNIIGNSGSNLDKKSNIHFFGWVNNVDRYIDDCFVYIRNTEHDGLPNLVLQSLLRGKYVMYPHKIPFTDEVSLDSLDNILKKEEMNSNGKKFIADNYSKEIFIKKFTGLYK